MLQYGRHERYSSTVQFIFCTCSPRRQPKDHTGQITFSFENHSLLLSSLQVQQKAVGFLPSAWGKTKGAPTQVRHLAIDECRKGFCYALSIPTEICGVVLHVHELSCASSSSS